MAKKKGRTGRKRQARDKSQPAPISKYNIGYASAVTKNKVPSLQNIAGNALNMNRAQYKDLIKKNPHLKKNFFD